jgi:hypothetical protein
MSYCINDAFKHPAGTNGRCLEGKWRVQTRWPSQRRGFIREKKGVPTGTPLPMSTTASGPDAPPHWTGGFFRGTSTAGM